MKRLAMLLALATTVSTGFAHAQTPAAPKPATHKTTTTPARKPGVAAGSGIKLPPGVLPVKGVLKTAFALKYQDFKIGTGALAEPGKVYKVHYTGWLASDGKKFDSSYDHRRPVLDARASRRTTRTASPSWAIRSRSSFRRAAAA